MVRRKRSKRTTIQPRKGDKRFIRRSKSGKFTKNQADAGRSLSRDRKRRAKRTVPKGQGDRGDQRRKKAI
jgi:hypothetical protein